MSLRILNETLPNYFEVLCTQIFCILSLDVLMFNEITTDLNSFYHSIVVRRYRNGAGNTDEENSGIFSLIRVP